eukprot:CAMPEP_0171596288 /NCGR_PEP_ID=MMETSP0990-20121206/1845_1 /TAXON_ID=483369 /ORGANISM="non described non described, Strain CCMP2098" /LENGTH=117 /DNA_ID=CAMNT_0012157439 /DNA_START=74 /DNA_END=428 /DNA_ORIENTATION=+
MSFSEIQRSFTHALTFFVGAYHWYGAEPTVGTVEKEKLHDIAETMNRGMVECRAAPKTNFFSIATTVIATAPLFVESVDVSPVGKAAMQPLTSSLRAATNSAMVAEAVDTALATASS